MNRHFEEIRTSMGARRVSAVGRTLVIHAEDGWVQPIRDGTFDFFTKLGPKLAQEGLATRIVTAGGTASKVLLGQDHVHLMVGSTPSYGPGILHAVPSYIWGFWYLDELGSRHHSSIRFAGFDPDHVDHGAAEYFFNGVSGYMLRENVSPIAQPDRLHHPLAPAAATILCQEIERQPERAHYLTTEEIIRITADACREEKVYVKLHPNQSKPMRRHIMAICADYLNVEISEASVHDQIAAARCVVTQNSGAGFEALMHRKTIITCGKTDYWHATLTPKNETDLRDALEFGPEVMKNFAFEKYLFWFLDRKCLEPQRQGFEARAWGRIAGKLIM
ncbi:hypothetical protein ACP2AV_05415 [Aliiroseovarius sp. PTFE2010]|uniref:capsular polysaccharide export protein, LipB/KpsS family n=1 Tax=Aliiroseovarius sp. PTFE2010 TaxID=3417190 RepID=UPI003CEDFA6E